MKTLNELLAERRPIEDALFSWVEEWKAACEARGIPEPESHLRPIEEALRRLRVDAYPEKETGA